MTANKQRVLNCLKREHTPAAKGLTPRQKSAQRTSPVAAQKTPQASSVSAALIALQKVLPPEAFARVKKAVT